MQRSSPNVRAARPRSTTPPTCASSTASSCRAWPRSCAQFLLESVSRTGGHLSSNLGTVELTVALHYVFDTPRDRLVWDVGHQTYAHKILTGRREAMARLAPLGGIAGFPRREESPYDTFGTAHSSTSISAALGMAVAARLAGEDRRVVAVIGDGAMTAGMAFEALNNAGAMDANLLVILNDNDMSISENVGALNNYLARLMSGRFYAAARTAGERMLSAHAAGARLRPPRRGAREGHGHAGHAVRGVRLQLHRSDRRPRPRRAGVDAHQHPGSSTARSSCTWSRARARATSWRRTIRSCTTASRKFDPAGGIQPQAAGQADLHPDLRRLAVRHGGARFAPDRHHSGDARRFRAGALLPGVSRPLFRRGHRRAARGHLRRRAARAKG